MNHMRPYSGSWTASIVLWPRIGALNPDQVARLALRDATGRSATGATTPPTLRPRPENHRAFTLIELLVVIAIIGMLAALLLPVLGKTMARVRRAECANDMRNLHMAFYLYKEDNNDWIPREGFDNLGDVYLNSWSEVRNPSATDVWYNVLPWPYMRKLPARDYALPSRQVAFYERQSKFHCPSARFPSGARDPVNPYAIFSRAMNSQLIQYPNIPTIRFNRIRIPVKTVLFLDNLVEGEKMVVKEQEKNNLGQPSAWVTRFAGRRHLRGGNLIFADGHLESPLGENVVTINGKYVGDQTVSPIDFVWEWDGKY